AYEFKGVFKVYMHPFVIETACVRGQKLAARLENLWVHFNKVDALNLVVSCQFLHHAAVASAYDKYVPCIWVDCHRNMGYHFVVYEFISFGEHDISVEHQHPAELRCLKDIYLLIIALYREKMTLYPDAVLDIGSMEFTEPKFHV